MKKEGKKVKFSEESLKRFRKRLSNDSGIKEVKTNDFVTVVNKERVWKIPKGSIQEKDSLQGRDVDYFHQDVDKERNIRPTYYSLGGERKESNQQSSMIWSQSLRSSELLSNSTNNLSLPGENLERSYRVDRKVRAREPWE